MPINSAGVWEPDISPKQNELRVLCRQKKFVLANGPRIAGKTIGAYHCIADHCWLTKKANFCVISISQTVGIDSGVWKDLTELILPQWIGKTALGEEVEDGGNFGMEWVRTPFIHGITKKPTCQISNVHGGVSTIQLESLKVEHEVEDRFKPRRYSGIYVPELSTFLNRKTFATWTECLRMIGMKSREHLFLADTNPPDDPCWWIHDIWWDLLEADETEIDPVDYGFKQEDEDALESLLALKHELARLDFKIEDNPYLEPERISQLKAMYAHNDELYRRYINGECVRTTQDSIFVKVFRPEFHVVGEVSGPENKEPETLAPEEDCYQLIAGWDPGVANSSAHIAERVMVDAKPTFKFLDELVVIGKNHKLENFVWAFMEKMAYWEQALGRAGKVIWKHWADRSVFDTTSPESKRLYHEIIYTASLEAIERQVNPILISSPIILTAADRGPGSVQPRVDLFEKLLFDERIFISAENCPKLVAMCKGIKRGKTASQPIMKGSPHKHPFDSASYLVSSECADDLNRRIIRNLRRGQKQSSLVSVPV